MKQQMTLEGKVEMFKDLWGSDTFSCSENRDKLWDMCFPTKNFKLTTKEEEQERDQFFASAIDDDDDDKFFKLENDIDEDYYENELVKYLNFLENRSSFDLIKAKKIREILELCKKN